MKEKFIAKYDPGKEISGADWLSLHRNENLFIGREWTVEAAKNLVEKADFAAYPNPNSEPLRGALAELHGVEPENIFVGNGSDEVLADLLDLLRHRYDTMSVLDVCFRIYLMLAERYRYRVEVLPGHTFETGRVAAAGWKGLAVVDSPNAITSACLSPADREALARAPNSFLIWDNAYGEFAGDVVPTDIHKNVVVVRSFSKFYALAGLRIGYCIADAALIAEMLARKDAFNVNSLAQIMALEALRRQEYFNAIRDQILQCRQELARHLQNFGFKMHRPAGNYILATHPAFTAEWLQEELMQRHIAVRRFPGQLTANYLRITVPPLAGIERLTAALHEMIKS